FEQYFRAVQGLEYRRFRTWGDVANVDFNDYKFMWIGNYEAEAWVADYNRNLARIEEFVDNGGALYHSSGTNNHNNRPVNPGGLVYTWGQVGGDQSHNQCPLQLDPEENFLINYMNENDPFDWRWGRGQQLVGSGCAHGVFLRDNIARLENVDEDDVQIMALGNPVAQPIILTYKYGHGYVVALTTVDGFLHNSPANYHWGRTGVGVLWYLDFLANMTTWIDWEPDEGTLSAGEDMDIVLTFNPEGLEDNTDYSGVLQIESNDPRNPLVEIFVNLGTGVPELEHYVDFTETGTAHQIVVNQLTFDDQEVPTRWEVGVFTPGGVLSGAGVYRFDFGTGFDAYGAAGNVNQFQAGQRFNFEVWDFESGDEYTAEAYNVNGPMVWASGSSTELYLRAYSERTIDVPIRTGWNIISINVTPPQQMWVNQNGPDIMRMIAQFAQEGARRSHIELMKDERGAFCSPAWNFSNIPFWNLTEGYQVKIYVDEQNVVGHWTGAPIAADAPITIAPSWNMIAYFPTYQLDATAPNFYVVSPIVDFVGIAKDGLGRFMTPRWNFSNMAPWTQGQGYQIRIDSENPVVLRYPAERRVAAVAAEEPGKTFWADPVRTGVNMSVLVTSIAADNGAQIGAFATDGKLVGAGVVQDNRCGIAVWGDDPSTDKVDGLQKDEAFTLRLWNGQNSAISDLEVKAIYNGKGLVFGADEFSALDMTVKAAIPDAFYLSQNYPNPFNNVTRIAYGAPEAAHITVTVFDVAGRAVATLIDGDAAAGNHVIAWDAAGASAGVYLVQMRADGFESIQKMMLVK
ncbi:MAG: T9SS type A sorting domain-containing protein, partial [Calditrichota bacterium]